MMLCCGFFINRKNLRSIFLFTVAPCLEQVSSFIHGVKQLRLLSIPAHLPWSPCTSQVSLSIHGVKQLRLLFIPANLPWSTCTAQVLSSLSHFTSRVKYFWDHYRMFYTLTVRMQGSFYMTYIQFNLLHQLETLQQPSLLHMKLEKSLQKSFQKTVLMWGKMMKIQRWEHYITLCVCVFPYVFKLLAHWILCGPSRTILDHWVFQCVISLAGMGQKLKSGPKPGRKQEFWKINEVADPGGPGWLQVEILSCQELFHFYRKGQCTPKIHNWSNT